VRHLMKVKSINGSKGVKRWEKKVKWKLSRSEPAQFEGEGAQAFTKAKSKKFVQEETKSIPWTNSKGQVLKLKRKGGEKTQEGRGDAE